MSELEISTHIIDAAIEVHLNLGPNAFGSQYESCLAFELKRKGVDVKSHLGLPMVYKNIVINNSYTVSLLVGKKILVDVKSVEGIYEVHKNKMKKFLKETGYKEGLVLNFNVINLNDGIKRINNG